MQDFIVSLPFIMLEILNITKIHHQKLNIAVLEPIKTRWKIVKLYFDLFAALPKVR